MKPNDRAKLVERGMKLTWASLASHLPYLQKGRGKSEPPRFHKRAVREYAELLQILSKLF